MKQGSIFILAVFLMTGCASTNIPASKATDAQLTCPMLVQEIGEMNNLITKSGGTAVGANVAGAGTSIGMSAATMSASSIGGALPYVGGAVNALGGLAGMSKANAEKTIQAAQGRINTLNGIYIGRNCDAELKAAQATKSGANAVQLANPEPVKTV